MNRAALFTPGMILSLAIASVQPLPAQQTAAQWSPKAAASYLDGRLEWWTNWPKAARDHDTYCVSCHTAVPYAIARHTLRSRLGESGPSATEKKLLANVSKRVGIWAEAEPFYNDKTSGPNKSYEARGTESVLNSLILVTADAETGNGKLSDTASKALAAMWEQQIATGDAKGSFPWLDFHNRPWEADDSPYYGAALAAIAVGSAPAGYLQRADVQQHLESLRGYLQREFAKQSPLNRMVGLWADAKIHGIVGKEQRAALMDEIFSAQQADGGWSLTSIAGAWKRRDNTSLETKSDGYATGLVAWVLQQAGMPRSSGNVSRALGWLETNQSKTDGLWLAWSLNKERDPESEIGRFMIDASTSYAVMALTSE